MRIVREVFQQELREVQGRLVEIAELVHVSITRATSAFNDSDVALAEVVIAEDADIDEAALALDELAIDMSCVRRSSTSMPEIATSSSPSGRKVPRRPFGTTLSGKR